MTGKPEESGACPGDGCNAYPHGGGYCQACRLSRRLRSAPQTATGRPVRGEVISRAEWCKFTAGSLYCVKDDCRNPNHRQEGRRP